MGAQQDSLEGQKNVWLTTEWYHIAITHNASTSTLYVDGEVDGTGRYDGAGLGGALTIGSRAKFGHFDGKISTFMVYDRELSQEEVQRNFNAQKGRFKRKEPYRYDPILEGLIAAYQFEDTDDIFTSEVGRTYANGISSGTTSTGSFSGAGNSLLYTIAGDSYSAVSYSAEFEVTGSNAVTMMCDIYPQANGGSSTSNICGLFRTSEGSHVYHLGYNSSNQIRGRIYTTVANNVITTATCPLSGLRGSSP